MACFTASKIRKKASDGREQAIMRATNVHITHLCTVNTLFSIHYYAFFCNKLWPRK